MIARENLTNVSVLSVLEELALHFHVVVAVVRHGGRESGLFLVFGEGSGAGNCARLLREVDLDLVVEVHAGISEHRVLVVEDIHGANALVEVVCEIVTLDPDLSLPDMKSVVVHIWVDQLTIGQLAPLDVVLPVLHEHVVAKVLLDILIIEVEFHLDAAMRADTGVSVSYQSAAGALLQLRLPVRIAFGEEVLREEIEG